MNSSFSLRCLPLGPFRPRLSLVVLSAFVLAMSACATAWAPPAPQGRSWSYARNGAIRTTRSIDVSTSGNWRTTRKRAATYHTHGQRAKGAGFGHELFGQQRQQGRAHRTRFNKHLGAAGEPLQGQGGVR
jgi:hypothetical protein